MLKEEDMDVFKDYLSSIDSPDHRLRMEEILSWTADQFPNLEAQIKWNTPMFTDHGTFIIGFAAAKHHVSVSPKKLELRILPRTLPVPATALLPVCSEFNGLNRCIMVA